MDGLNTWIQTNGDSLKLTMTIVISVVAIIFAGWLVISAMSAFKAKKMNDGVKSLMFAGLVVVVALMGIGGIFALVEMIAPNQSIIPRN